MKPPAALKQFTSLLKETLPAILDKVSELTGYAATRVPLKGASRPNKVTLALPGYMQLDSFSRGAVAAAMVVKYFRPSARFERIYARINPDPNWGASTKTVARALRQFGVRVRIRSKLTFGDLCGAIDADSPVLVTIHNPRAQTDHWVVVYGYGRKPNRVFIASNGIPFFHNAVPLRKFSYIWSPRGNGLICENRKRGRKKLS